LTSRDHDAVLRAMDIDQFWSLIEASRRRFAAREPRENMDAQKEDLAAALREPHFRVIEGKLVARRPIGEEFNFDDATLRSRYPQIASALGRR
jgi:hypothetical protein